MELMQVDPKKIEALIMSHGHFDHWGGLARIPRQAPQGYASRPYLVRRRRGQLLPRYVNAHQASLPTLACWIVATSAARTSRSCWRNSGRHRRACFHHWQDQAHEHREGAAEYAWSNSDKDGAGLQCAATTAGRDGRQDRARRAHPRACHVLQREGQGPDRDLLLRPCRHRQFGAASHGSIRRAERFMRSWAAFIWGRRRPITSRRSWPRSASSIRMWYPDALQRAQFHPGSDAANAWQGAEHDDRHPHHLRGLIAG